MNHLESLAENTANRLRLIQAQFDDNNGEERSNSIEKEVTNSLKKVEKDQKEKFLYLLASRFPIMENPAPPPEEENPEKILERMLQIIPTLPDEQKKFFHKQLVDAGLIDKTEPFAQPEHQDDDLRKKEELLNHFINLVTPIDRSLKNLCQQLHRHVNKRACPDIPFGDLEQKLELSKSRNVKSSVKEIEESLGNLSTVICFMLASIPRIPVTYERNHLSKIAPQELERKFHGDIFGIKEARCWKEYKKRYSDENLGLFTQKMQAYFGQNVNIILDEIARKARSSKS